MRASVMNSPVFTIQPVVTSALACSPAGDQQRCSVPQSATHRPHLSDLGVDLIGFGRQRLAVDFRSPVGREHDWISSSDSPAACLSRPTLLPAVTWGLAIAAVLLFLMQPAMGAGLASSRTPTPLKNCLRSFANHAVFCLGLHVGAAALTRPAT